jgi:hypothetical protein
MNLFEFMAENPWLSFFLFYMFCHTLVYVAEALGNNKSE